MEQDVAVDLGAEVQIQECVTKYPGSRRLYSRVKWLNAEE